MPDFKLSAQLTGHESDVRAVSFPTPDTVISASRDRTVRVWRRTSQQPPVFEASVTTQGSDFINSLAFIPPSAEFTKGLVVSGGKDIIIDARSPESSPTDNADRLLIGHANNVCTLDVSPKGTIVVSGGWDGQAIVWNIHKGEAQMVLGGHDGQGVWSVLAVNETTVVTGCADKKIRVFDLQKHTAGVEVQPVSVIPTPDIIRALCAVPKSHSSGADIASASNDGVIRLWWLNGQQAAELHGHENFIYSLASLPNGELVSSGEDRTVRVWKGLECIQTITHPALSVWTVAVCRETGDIVSGASDGVARIFTRSSDRAADAETLRQFEESIQASSIPEQQMEGINKEKIPGPDFLKNKSGTKEGQIQLIKEEDGSISAHQWSISQQQWINVGTVVDSAASSGRKAEYMGEKYDYVFDVDIKDGEPALKLPYNLSENPYERATKFLADNELPMSYQDQVAHFIIENTKGATLGQSQEAPDSFGTQNRYRPGDGDVSRRRKPLVLPQKEYLKILDAKFDPIFKKLFSINEDMIKSNRKETAFNPSNQLSLRSLHRALTASEPWKESDLSLVVVMATRWPYADRLPGLDIIRCMAASPMAAKFSHESYGSILEIAVKSALTPDVEGQKINDNLVMMSARTLVNLFATAEGWQLVAGDLDRAIGFLERIAGLAGGDMLGKTNQRLWLAVATAAVNFAVLGQALSQDRRMGPEDSARVMKVIREVLGEQSDPEVLFRTLLALGTYLCYAGSKKDVVSLGAEDWVKRLQGRTREERVLDACAQCLELIV